MEDWNMFYPSEWNKTDVLAYAAFIYLIQFPDTDEFYIGVKSVWKGIKNKNDIKYDSKESNWRTYTSSSKVVNAYINDSMNYKKSILWCYDTHQEAALAETALISVFGTRWDCLNMAIMVKTRLKKDRGQQRDVLQRILGDLM